ncbi:MAG TPA: purine-nucleoside phosphorylase [Pirellulaceae bacterium]|nr:purine-nucleoside phosphorylase [Pirellulaceae bacterium]
MKQWPDLSREPEVAARESAQWVRQRWRTKPRIGIILGTGAGPLGEQIQAQHIFDYSELPHFPASTAIGHLGRLICGTLTHQPVVAMQGRFHLYEGYSVARATLGVRLMAELGVDALFVSNAAGGIHPSMESGDVMVIDNHIDLMFGRAAMPWPASNCLGRPDRRTDEVYCPQLIAEAQRIARRSNWPLFQGTYVAMLGPNFETRAEYRFLRKIGGDAVGMSTVPETCLARALGLRVLAVSIVANVARPDVLQPTSGEEVVDFAKKAGPKLKTIFEHVAANLR